MDNKEIQLTAIITPITDEVVKELSLGEPITITGYIFTGRDAVLPRLVNLIKTEAIQSTNICLQGSVIFHTAVSPAGIGPTSSNKYDIESTIPELSKAGVKLHLGKGALQQPTVEALNKHNAIYAVIPPVTALLTSKVTESQIVAFPEEGMEALHKLKVIEFPAVISAIHGKSLFNY